MGPRAVVVSGPAASGKSTLGAGLAARLGTAFLDQDVLTNALVTVVAGLAGTGEDIDHPRLRALVRQARYAALADTAAAQLACGTGVVAVAPFTLEISAPTAWAALTRRLLSSGADRVDLVWLDCPAPELLRRLRSRAATRDRAKIVDGPAAARFVAGLRPPAVPALRIDATLAPQQQLEDAVTRLG